MDYIVEHSFYFKRFRLRVSVFIAKSWTNYTSRQTERTLAENGLSEHRIEIIADLHLQNIITN